MEIVKIVRKGRPLFVRKMMVSELDKTKCSARFLSHELNDDVLVNVKCHEDGTFDLRGKKEEYRIIVPDPEPTEKEINDYLKKTFRKLKQDSLFDLNIEFGKLLLIKIENFSQEQRKRYDELRTILHL